MKPLSIDVETYGLYRRTVDGRVLPQQNHFHPKRCVLQDGVAPADLIQLVSITIPEGQTCSPFPSSSSNLSTSEAVPIIPTQIAVSSGSPISSTDSLSMLKDLRPGKTITFQLHLRSHRMMLAKWLAWSDALVGFNLLYDILFLRAYPEFKHLLDHQLLVDASIFNSYHSESRAFYGLGDVAVALGLAAQTWKTPEGFRYERPDDPASLRYNATDTHVTILVLAELFRRLMAERWSTSPNPDATVDYIVRFYSQVLRSCLAMTENGIAFNKAKLENLRDRLLLRRDRTQKLLLSKYNFIITGTKRKATKNRPAVKGRDESRQELMDYAATQLSDSQREYYLTPTPYHLCFKYQGATKDKPIGNGKLSFDDQNRNLMSALLPSEHPLQAEFRFISRWTSADKLLTSYVLPLLDPIDKSAALPYPPNPEVLIAYPTWFPIRSLTKEGTGGGGGGTRQSRLAARNPAGQTFPPAVAACQSSRYKGGTVVSVDLSQIELRGSALSSGDPFLVSVFVDGRDQHTGLAIFCEGPQIVDNPNFGSGDRRTDPRQWYKQSNFLISYRGGWTKFQATLLKLTGRLFPEEFCRKVVADTRRLQAGLWQWQDIQIRIVRETGRLTLPLTMHSRDFQEEEGPEICNFPIQSLAAIEMLSVASHLTPRLPKPILLFQNIHDALKLDCPPGKSKEGTELLTSSIRYTITEGYWAQMEKHFGRHIPVTYKVSTHA